jgi:coenzyme F420-0:L-glutamate ligase/coenzyme F420-1:gamma-L-glutamate ligase
MASRSYRDCDASPAKAMSASSARIELLAVEGVPHVQPGDDLAAVLAAALRRSGLALQRGDVLAVAQKIVSKAEGRFVELADVRPSPEAAKIAAEIDKDPRIVEVILSESTRVVRKRRGLLIVEHRLGFVMANAGVDQSNTAPGADGQRVLMLPKEPDASAEKLRAALSGEFGTEIAVIVTDSFGRAWRHGTTGTAIGAAGLPALVDLRGQRRDLYGRMLQDTMVGFADEIASAASLLMGQADEGRPAVIVRGLDWSAPSAPATALVRPAEEDLFR